MDWERGVKVLKSRANWQQRTTIQQATALQTEWSHSLSTTTAHEHPQHVKYVSLSITASASELICDTNHVIFVVGDAKLSYEKRLTWKALLNHAQNGSSKCLKCRSVNMLLWGHNSKETFELVFVRKYCRILSNYNAKARTSLSGRRNDTLWCFFQFTAECRGHMGKTNHRSLTRL